MLEHCSITPSMSRKGNCWDNACSETLFGSLKVERLHGKRFETIRQAKDEIIAWLLWYNQTRMHSTLNYLSPVEFEQGWKDDLIGRSPHNSRRRLKQVVEMPGNRSSRFPHFHHHDDHDGMNINSLNPPAKRYAF